ncbi:phosphatidylinositol-specific phospholipase C/glycerophosphodiester phosphodiesterase family protein [Lacipirellula parvula]|uniref:Altered inheritance of mitochondria protein 6 n=1 Tax=Lacipirellula parvula TaxID=2650471 RepID=A0A5K7XDM3_9BACT|nr:phosphatidylinositol-specific phospholipase C/glycerophosphodiester phosphodiesterase family protein [Lacipirellula parvula]BBO32941.1 putative secreted protein [Lacipirellula parvula]
MRSTIALPCIFVLSLATSLCRGEAPAPPRPLPQAHSHNDYEHDRPLLDALDRGFCNVEADVYLVDGKLLVAHDWIDLRPQRTLEALYLEPLKEQVEKNGGKLFPGDQRLTLLIDFKSDGEKTYPVLAATLKKYEDLISGMHDGKWTPRQIDVIISGNRPIELVANDKQRLAGLDGRVSDLDDANGSEAMPLVSDNWSSHFKWRGEGDFPAVERERLKTFVTKAHGQGRRLRFWGTPDTPEFWGVLQGAGVDVIGTDDLGALQRYLDRD